MVSGGRSHSDPGLKEWLPMYRFQGAHLGKNALKTPKVLIYFFRFQGAHVLLSEMSIFNKIIYIYLIINEHLRRNSLGAQTNDTDMSILDFDVMDELLENCRTDPKRREYFLERADEPMPIVIRT